MTEQKDCERFTKGFCVPRDLVVNGELIKTVLLEDKAAFKSKDGGNAGFRAGAREEKRASIIRDELIKRKRKEKLIRERILAGKAKIAFSEVTDEEAAYVNINDDDFAGLSGFSESLFLQQLDSHGQSMDLKRFESHRHDVNNCDYRSKICGKIQDYLYMDEKKSGHLSVQLMHEEFLTKKSFVDCKPECVTTYHWDIEIPEYGFIVLHRNDAALDDPTQPLFLDMPKGVDGEPVVAFPPHAIDPEDPRSVWCRGLDHKLLAKGKEHVKIENVFRKVECCNPSCDLPECGKLIRLSDTKEGEKKFYVSTEESCVDLMFKGYPPCLELPPQVEYCLGRCENPPIINSGGR